MKKSAFTLIELLVVITIIGILAAVALPVYNRVIESARSTQDSSNMKQIGTAILSYLGDNDQQYFAGTAAAGSTWPEVLNSKYIPSWKVFQSPFDKRTPSENPTTSASPVSYAVNTNLFDKDAGKVKYSTQLILLAPSMEDDPAIKFQGLYNNNPKLAVPVPVATNFRGTIASRKRIGVLYSDYHVESGLTWTKFSDSTTTDGVRRWDPAAP